MLSLLRTLPPLCALAAPLPSLRPSSLPGRLPPSVPPPPLSLRLLLPCKGCTCEGCPCTCEGCTCAGCPCTCKGCPRPWSDALSLPDAPLSAPLKPEATLPDCDARRDLDRLRDLRWTDRCSWAKDAANTCKIRANRIRANSNRKRRQRHRGKQREGILPPVRLIADNSINLT